MESIRRIVTAITVVTKEAWLPFGFNCWQSSRPSSEHIYMNTSNLSSSPLWISKSLLSHWLPAIQIFRLSNLVHIPLFKLLSISHVHSWYSDLSFRLLVLMLLNVLTILFVFLWVRGPAHSKNGRCHVLVWALPRTVCAFLRLRHDDNILQQYIDTFLATSPNFIETAYSCRFEKFRIKRQQKQQIQMTS